MTATCCKLVISSCEGRASPLPDGPFPMTGLLRNWKFRFLKNPWALKCNTIEDQLLNHWYLEGWKCPGLSWPLRWSQVQQLWVLLYLPALCFSCSWERRAGWIGPEEKWRWIRNYFLSHSIYFRNSQSRHLNTAKHCVKLPLAWRQDLSKMRAIKASGCVEPHELWMY